MKLFILVLSHSDMNPIYLPGGYMTDVPLKCSCGTVTGVASGVSASVGNRLICCCASCQKFAHYLEQGDRVLDEFGGTDIFQMPISNFKLITGKDQVRCVHITEGGPYRWYADCCKTPMGNTGGPGLPFIGMIHNFMDDAGSRDENLGPVQAYGHTGDAIKTIPAEQRTGSTFGMIVRFLFKLLTWKLQGKNKPNPLFDSAGNPISEPARPS